MTYAHTQVAQQFQAHNGQVAVLTEITHEVQHEWRLSNFSKLALAGGLVSVFKHPIESGLHALVQPTEAFLPVLAPLVERLSHTAIDMTAVCGIAICAILMKPAAGWTQRHVSEITLTTFMMLAAFNGQGNHGFAIDHFTAASGFNTKPPVAASPISTGVADRPPGRWRLTDEGKVLVIDRKDPPQNSPKLGLGAAA